MIKFWNTSRGRVAAEFQTTWTTMLWRFLLLLSFAASAIAQKPAFTVGWSVYAGWTPYHYLNKSGILRKWADKYGITIKVQRFDYAPSLDAFVAKNIDACTMTNMEALDMPAASGVPTTAILVGDYSNGNDALLVRNGLQLKDLAGQEDAAGGEDGLRIPVRPRDDDQQSARSDQARAHDQHQRFRHCHGIYRRYQRVGRGHVEAAWCRRSSNRRA